MPFSRLTLALALALASAAVSADPDRIVLPDTVVPDRYQVSIVPDAAHMSFTGAVKIDVTVRKATRTLELNSADLAFKRAGIVGMAPPKLSFDTEQETATLTFRSPVSAGHHVLVIDYTGKINPDAAGLFALDYDTPQGKARALFTQFENSDARRFMPCWDEPGIKAVFELSATVPAGEMALSNTPIAGTKKLKHGLVRVKFAPTPRMSSYLLFFGLGDFERISRKVDGVDVGVVVKRGDADKARYALDVASQILPYYEDYFGVKYPLPKLDLVAGPGQSQVFGAMENWGAIFYFERDLLIDSRITTQEDQRGVYEVIAHEMAHMWFGDLVTMSWWDEIWLNEGFASWMEVKATDHFHPEWKASLGYLDDKQAAMSVDSRAGTHPIITPIRDVLQADQSFDTITYEKGAAVIRMLEVYVGADAFRDGVRAYIKAHAYGNTVTDDLWREMDKGATLPVTQVAHDFTLQAGVPMIRVTATPAGLHLVQDRYSVDDSGKAGGSWRVPVSVASIAGADPWRGLVSREQPADVTLSAGTVSIVNYGQTAYFRSLYDEGSFGKIAANFQVLAPADQLGLLNDSLALGEAGDEPMSDGLSLMSAVTPDLDPTVENAVVDHLDGLNFYYEGLPTQAAYQAYARKLLAPLLAKLGWTAQPGEDGNVTVLRTDLLHSLGDLDDPDVIAGARSRFGVYLKDPTSLRGDLRSAVLRIIARHADKADWDALHTLAKAATSNLEKRQLYVLLGTAHDPALAKQALDLSLSDEMPVTVRPAMLAAVSYFYPDMAFDYLTAHADVYDKLLEPSTRASFAPRLIYTAHDAAIFAKLDAYAAARIPAEDRGDVVRAEAGVDKTIKIRSERLPDVDAWLAAHAN